jgi:hypothetical protein
MAQGQEMPLTHPKSLVLSLRIEPLTPGLRAALEVANLHF